jgi:transcriptional regulator with XRE-family HTH domain
MKDFGAAWKEARLNAEKTVREVAKYLELSAGYVSDIENGRRGAPDLETVKKYEKFVHVHDNSLVELASRVRTKIPSEVLQRVQMKPLGNEMLYRLADMSDEEMKDFLERNPRKD